MTHINTSISSLALNNVKGQLTKCKVDKWMQDLFYIASHNAALALYWKGTTRLSEFMDEQVNYMDKYKKLDGKTIKELREIVSFASQFYYPMEKSVFNVYGSHKPYLDLIPALKTRYSGLLEKYKVQIKKLSKDQHKKLDELLKPVETELNALVEKFGPIYDSGYNASESFHNATREIHYAMEYIDKNKNVAQNVGIVNEKILICKREMANPSLEKTIKSTTEKLKPVLNQAIITQKDLIKNIEDLLNAGAKKSTRK